MDDKSKQVLTTFLGECWHERSDNSIALCAKCSKILGTDDPNRTFDTWEDFGVLKNKIVEIGEWDKFIEWLIIGRYNINPVNLFEVADLFSSVLNKFQGPLLVLEAIKEGVLK